MELRGPNYGVSCRNSINYGVNFINYGVRGPNYGVKVGNSINYGVNFINHGVRSPNYGVLDRAVTANCCKSWS